MNTDYKTELVRQFGKHDASMFALAPHKYAHQFDAKALTVYINALRAGLFIAHRHWREPDKPDSFRKVIESVRCGA